MSYMIVPDRSVFNVIDDSNGQLVGAYPTARAAALAIARGVLPSDTSYNKLMAEAKAQYDAEIKELENMKASKLLDKITRQNARGK
jgi:hypothetical protein